MNSNRNSGLAGMALAIVAGVAVAASSDYPKYRLTDLGLWNGKAVYPSGLNASGQMSANVEVTTVTDHAFFWADDGTPLLDITPNLVTADSSSLNALGEVTGMAEFSSNQNYAFLWKNDGTPVMSLGSLGGTAAGQSSNGLAINDSGQVTGFSSTAGAGPNHAFLWANDGHPMRDLGTLGGKESYGYGINASGQVTGSSDLRGSAAYHAFLWKNNGTAMIDLGSLGGANSNGLFINDRGQVAGISTVDAQGVVQHAFLWRNDGKPMVDLGTLGGPSSTPAAMNASGQVVGQADRANNNYYRAFLWRNDGTPMQGLGSLGTNRSTSSATDINSSGWVTGWSYIGVNRHGFLWKDNGLPMQDLQALIDPADPLVSYVVLYQGLAINDAGDILALGEDFRTAVGTHAYLMRGSMLVFSTYAFGFGKEAVGGTSAPKSLAVRNVSTSAVPVTSVALAGAGAGQFSQTNNCGSSVAAKGTCTIKVTFKPTAKGAKTATLSVNGGGGGLRVLNLSGTGT